MNLTKLTKANLISQLEKRCLPTNGLKDELIKRLKEAIEKENMSENENQEENYDSEDENVEEIDKEGKAMSNQDSDTSDRINETLNDDENVKEVNSSEIDASTLTVDDAINMKSSSDVENYSMIVNINDDDISMPNSNNDSNDPTSGSRDIDNGEHEVIEISEEVIIDDEDNQENDNNYNEEPFHNDQTQQDKSEIEIGQSREEDTTSVKEKITLWIHNIAEDVKAIELKELFGKYGKITSAKVVMNGKDATGNCFGCIELSNNDDAESCITNLDKTEFRGNIITISRNICDLAPKEIIQRNISPISSTDSWGGDGKNKEKSKSLSPFICEPLNQENKEEADENDGKYKAPYRGRGGYRGNNYRGYGSRNEGPDTRGKQQDYRRGNDSRSTYAPRPEKYGDDSTRRSFRSNNDDNDNRSRDNYIRRDTRGGRDEYGGSKGGDSRYQPITRDRYPNNNNRPINSRYEEEGRSGALSRYGNYEHHSSYDDRHGDRRLYHDRVKESDYATSRRYPDVPFKRPRLDHDDYYGSKSRRREYTPDRSGPVIPRDRYRAPSPKRSFYYSDKESYRPQSDTRDRRDLNYMPSSSGDRRTDQYSSRKTTVEYGHGPYSPATSGDRSRLPPPSSRSHKDSFPTDFGGRSRNYDR